MIFTVAAIILFTPFDQLAERLGVFQPNEPRSGTVANGSTAISSEEATPFQDVLLERAKEKARKVIDSFTGIQHEFEQQQYAQYSYQTEYSAIQILAVQGDELFKNRDFDAAIAEYQKALTELELLQEQIDREFEKAIRAAFDYLERRQNNPAKDAFELARTIKPLHPRVASGLARLEVLPEVNELLRESERAILREEWDLARVHLDKVQNLDPLTVGLEDKRTIIQAKQDEQVIRDLLSEAHQALSENDFTLAQRKFNEVLTREPKNTAAQTGIDQTEQSRLIYQIQTLRAEAESVEKELDFVKALEIYEQILAIDSSLTFAVEGRRRVYEVINATRQMQSVLSDPHALSVEENFQSALEVLENAKKHQGHSEQYDQILQDYSNLVDYASELITVTFVSDNLTEVLLVKRGSLGTFESKELKLRPGRYDIVGSRDGWIDVRQTIVIKPNMGPVEITCVEQI